MKKFEDHKNSAMMWAYLIFCKFFCQNRLKLFFTGEKKNKTVGFLFYPRFCSRCKKFDKTRIAVYKRMGRWN